MITTPCCEKCFGVVRDENEYGNDYGCLRDDCPCHSPQDQSWEEEFDEAFSRSNWVLTKSGAPAVGEWIKDFIRAELASQKNRILEGLPKEKKIEKIHFAMASEVFGFNECLYLVKEVISKTE